MRTEAPKWTQLQVRTTDGFVLRRTGGYKVDEIIPHRLKIVSELVSRLIQLDVICAGHDHHDDATILELLDSTSELRPFRPQLFDRRLNVVAHEGDRVVPRVIV